MSAAVDAKPAPVSVMSALILRAIVDETIMPEFEKTGGAARMIWDPTVGLMRRIGEGEKADAIVAIDWAIDELQARGLIDTAWPMIEERGITLVGISVGNFDQHGAVQLELPLEQAAGYELDAALDAVRERFGSASVTRAVLLGRDPGLTMPMLPD